MSDERVERADLWLHSPMPDETATLKQALGALREASGAMVGLRRAYDELAADYERLGKERDLAEQRGAQRERERIASLFDDLYPEWAAVIRNETVSKDRLFSRIDEQRAPTLERRRNQAIAELEESMSNELRRYECEWKPVHDLNDEAMYAVLYHETAVPTEGYYYLSTDVDPILAEKNRQIARLREYTQHAPLCESRLPDEYWTDAAGQCTCGLDQLLAELEDTNDVR